MVQRLNVDGGASDRSEEAGSECQVSQNRSRVDPGRSYSLEKEISRTAARAVSQPLHKEDQPTKPPNEGVSMNVLMTTLSFIGNFPTH